MLSFPVGNGWEIIMDFDKKEGTMKSFSSTDTRFINYQVILHFVPYLSFGVMFIVVSFIQQQMFVLLIAAFFLFYPPGYKSLYYRWLSFRFNKTTELSIDTEHLIFSYKHKEKLITFHSNDVEKWWTYEFGPFCTPFVEIVEIRLRNGEKVIISSGLKDAVSFICSNSNHLGLPEQYLMSTHEKYKSFLEYIEDINY